MLYIWWNPQSRWESLILDICDEFPYIFVEFPDILDELPDIFDEFPDI